MLSGLARQMLERLLARPGFLVGAYRSERVVHVGHGDDARAEGNVVTDQSVRVTRAVVLLMVTERDQRAHADILGRAAFQDLVPDHRMPAHDVPLARVELGRLEE